MQREMLAGRRLPASSGIVTRREDLNVKFASRIDRGRILGDFRDQRRTVDRALDDTVVRPGSNRRELSRVRLTFSIHLTRSEE